MWETRTKAGPAQIRKLETFVNSLTSQWESIFLLQDYGALLSKEKSVYCAKAANTERVYSCSYIADLNHT